MRLGAKPRLNYLTSKAGQINCPALSFFDSTACQHEILQQRGGFVHAEHSRVDGNVVVLGAAPILAGVEIIVGSAFFIRLSDKACARSTR